MPLTFNFSKAMSPHGLLAPLHHNYAALLGNVRYDNSFYVQNASGDDFIGEVDGRIVMDNKTGFFVLYDIRYSADNSSKNWRPAGHYFPRKCYILGTAAPSVAYQINVFEAQGMKHYNTSSVTYLVV